MDILNQDRIKILRDLGCTITHEYKYIGEGPERRKIYLPDTVAGVDLPLNPAEWLSVAMRDGDYYLGGCCGDLSALQDIINESFRDSAYISNPYLCEVFEIAKGHGVGSEYFSAELTDLQFDTAVENWATLTPWDKIGLVASTCEPALAPRSIVPFPEREEKEEAHTVISTLGRVLQNVSWQDLFERREGSAGDQHDASRVLNLAKLLPLTKDLLQTLESSKISFNGVGLVNENDTVLTNGYGVCMYLTEEDGLRALELIKRSSTDVLGDIRMRQVTVTVANGMVLGEEIPLKEN